MFQEIEAGTGYLNLKNRPIMKSAVTLLCCLLFTSLSQPQAVLDEKRDVNSILSQFYNATNGPNWKNSMNWLGTESVCDWFGVVCKQEDVASLILSHNRLSGTIPGQCLSMLLTLDYLDLSFNSISGSLPADFFDSGALELAIVSSNSLVGHIPDLSRSVDSLTFLDLGSNMLEGDLPPSLWMLTKASRIDISDNSFHTTLPSDLSSVSSLVELELNNNELRGELPARLPTTLQYFDFSNNTFDGTLPESWGEMKNVRDANLGHNRINGSLPDHWRTFGDPEISSLDISHNHMSGFLPDWAFEEKVKEYLHLQSNRWWCPVPIWCGTEGNNECGECDDPGPCCTDHNHPACRDPEIAGCVCEFQNSCCTESWSNECVKLVSEHCGSCANGECCWPNETPSCENDDISQCVCKVLESCCKEGEKWTQECVDHIKEGGCSNACLSFPSSAPTPTQMRSPTTTLTSVSPTPTATRTRTPTTTTLTHTQMPTPTITPTQAQPPLVTSAIPSPSTASMTHVTSTDEATTIDSGDLALMIGGIVIGSLIVLGLLAVAAAALIVFQRRHTFEEA